jgi:hypothetical protein
MAKPFAFPPPPPPPPPRNDLLTGSPPHTSGFPGFLSVFGNSNSRRVYGPSGGRAFDGGFGGRGSTGRSRGRAGVARGGYYSRSFDLGFNGAREKPQCSAGLNINTLESVRNPPCPYRGEKRNHSTAFQRPTTSLPRPQAAPAVPSFGADILPIQASPLNQAPSPKKRPRKHNQLGLTPASEDHQSSSNEDEETQLATNASYPISSTPGSLSFEYKGRTSNLRTEADIAAWIAERRRNYPTAAKAEVAKKKAEEQRRLREASRKERDEERTLQGLETQKHKQDELRRRALESVEAKQAKKGASASSQRAGSKKDQPRDKATDLATKKEKIMRRLEKAKREAQRAEKALSKMLPKPHDTSCDRNSDWQATKESPIEQVQPHGSGTQEDFQPSTKLAALKQALLAQPDTEDSGQDTSDDWTSSSESSLDSEASFHSGSESHCDPESGFDSPPEETTSKRTAPDRVPPPERADSSSQARTNGRDDQYPPRILCKNMLRAGRCSFGVKCRYSHDVEPLGQRAQAPGLRGERKGRQPGASGAGKETGKSTRMTRKGLYQIMVEKEVEEERKAVVQVIVEMGQRGMLEEQ